MIHARAILTRNATKSVLGTLAVLGFCLASSMALGDTTSLTVAAASKGTSSTPVTMLFPVTRTGDLGYEAILNYHTVDGTAFAGTDYTATTSSIVVPAGSATATVPVTLLTQTGNGVNLTFQLQLDSATGIGPVPSFATQQTFATGSSPSFVVAADINGDGKPDLIVTNANNNTVSVLLNTTVPGATTPTYAAQQTFATGRYPFSVTVADVNGDGRPDLIVANDADNTLSVLLNTTAPGATTLSFAAQKTFVTGSGAISITAADINGDGKPDLIVTNLDDSTVSVLLNTTASGASTASFSAQQAFATGVLPNSVTAADVNGDGEPDLIVANVSDNTVSVLLNATPPGASTASFAAQQTFATGSSPISVTTADVNGDGKRDLIVTNNGGNTVSVLLNTTTPGSTTASFAAQQPFATGANSQFTTVTDVNGDGKPDLIVANFNNSDVSVLINTTAPGATTPSFAAQQIFATGSGALSVAAADVNGDGKPDLIVVNNNNATVSVLLNTTAPPTATLNFAAQQIFDTEAFPNSVIAADLNGDGKLDLIVGNENATGGVSVLVNTTAPGAATPSFAAEQTFASGRYLYNAVAADVNGDGKLDLIMANSADNTLTVLLNTTAPGAATLSFAAPQTFATGSNPAGVAVADVNGDGKPDLIVADDGGNDVSVLLNTTAPGATTLSFATHQTFATGQFPHWVAVADVNGDGKPDLILANEGSANVSVLLNTTAPGATTPSFATQQAFTTGTFPYSVSVADVNGDGRPDLIVADNGNNYVSVLLNTTVPGATTPSFAAQQTVATGANPDFVTVADVDGDGRPDIISANYNGNSVSVLLNTTAPGATTVSFATQQTFSTGANPSFVTAADVNGDGKPDLIVANGGNSLGNTLSVLLNTQYQAAFAGSPATGTIVHDYIFANGFE